MKGFFIAFMVVSGVLSGFTQEVEQILGNYKFIENKGQWPQKTLFKADVDFGNIWLEQSGILYQFIDANDIHHADFSEKPVDDPKIKEHYLYLQFLNCLPNATIQKSHQTTEYYNYFLGNDTEKWGSGCYGYFSILYQELYQGIDAKIFEQKGQLKYEFKVKPSASPNQIQLKYNGYSKLKINKKGDLEVTTAVGKIYEEKPYAYQIKNGKILEVECDFKLDNGILSFEIGNYDHSLELVVDPALIFATYCGSPSDNFGMTATYAYDGKAYSGGTVYGNAYPTPALALLCLTLLIRLQPTYLCLNTLRMVLKCYGLILLEAETIHKEPKPFTV